ncbi:MAG: DUF4124 domain-containing protein [Pseudomonadales bacterium]|nr:DUF4124 domain-containing protein [Pseudomonadales bacterium]
MMNAKGLMMCLLLVVSLTSWAEIYQWKDEWGNTQFSNEPPEDTESSEVELPDINITPAHKTHPEFDSQGKKQATTNTNEQFNQQDQYCEKKRRKLAEIDAHLVNYENVKDLKKSKALKKLLINECGRKYLTQTSSDKLKDSNRKYCERKRRELSEVEVFLSHTSNLRDEKKVKTLKILLKKECLR